MAGSGLGQVVSWYICTIIPTSFLFLRLFSRWKRFGRLSLDDGFLILAACCLIGDLAIQQHMWNLGVGNMAAVSREQLIGIMKMIVPGSILYISSLWAIKVALVLFYKKLAAPGTKMQIAYNATLAGLAVTWLVVFFDILFQCFPEDKRWSTSPDYKCSPKASRVNYWITVLLNITSDVIIICLPITMVMGLQMKLKQRLGVASIFALGIFVVIASIIRAIYSWRNQTMLTCTVSMVENGVAIIGACLPALRAMFLGHTSQVGNSSYGRHYELSSTQQRIPPSQTITNVSRTEARGNSVDSDEELVGRAKSNLSGVSSIAGETGRKNGIVVNTSIAVHHRGQAESSSLGKSPFDSPRLSPMF